jgi:hypothetical protein
LFQKRRIGIGSRSQKVLDGLRMILDISASVAEVNELRLVIVSRGRVCGEELVVTVFKAVTYAVKGFCQRKKANI